MIKKQHRLLLGAHMSIAKGFAKAIEDGASIDCTTIQIFTKSNQQWHAKPLSSQEIEEFKEASKKYNITPTIAHAAYLINLGSPDAATAKKSIAAVTIELNRCEQLGIAYLVLHPGSHLATNEEECLLRIAHNLDLALADAPGQTIVALEIMAGQGSSVCYSFEHLATIINNSSYKDRIGICFDTAHAFAAGYDFRTEKSYANLWEQFDAVIGLNNLKVVHINDSKKDLGSYVDRHENIGKGTIGLEAFRLLFNDIRFFDVPKILETPKKTLEEDALNMETLKSLISEENWKFLKEE